MLKQHTTVNQHITTEKLQFKNCHPTAYIMQSPHIKYTDNSNHLQIMKTVTKPLKLKYYLYATYSKLPDRNDCVSLRKTEMRSRDVRMQRRVRRVP